MTTEMATRCGVTGPKSLWTALGYEYTPTEDQACCAHWIDGGVAALDAMVYEGRRQTGSDDWQALAWAVAEHERRKASKTAATAQAREAEGLQALAKSLQQAGDESVLDRVLSKLSERTQYAVRAQLKGSGIGGL
jgi:hypothetical protein